MRDQFSQQPQEILARLRLRIEHRQGVRRETSQDGARQARHHLGRGETKNVQHVLAHDLATAKGDQLIEHRFGVAQTALGAAGNGIGGFGSQLDALEASNLLQVCGDQRRGDAPQVEPLATAQDRGENLLRLGRGKDEFDVLRRLLQRLEQRVERSRRQHVDLVDDVDLILPARGGVADIVPQFAHLLDAIVAGAVDLQDVQADPAGNLTAGIANAARFGGRRVDAAERLGQDARGRRLADATRADEEISMREPVLRDRVFEGARDVFLADDVVKNLRPVLARENLVAHRRDTTFFHEDGKPVFFVPKVGMALRAGPLLSDGRGATKQTWRVNRESR